MGVPNATKYAAINAVTALGGYISAHTAAAGTTGANEGSGTGYGPRPQTTWPTNADPVTGSLVNLPVPAGTYVEFGCWSAASAGTFDWSTAFSGGNITVSGSGASIAITPSVSI